MYLYLWAHNGAGETKPKQNKGKRQKAGTERCWPLILRYPWRAMASLNRVTPSRKADRTGRLSCPCPFHLHIRGKQNVKQKKKKKIILLSAAVCFCCLPSFAYTIFIQPSYKRLFADIPTMFLCPSYAQNRKKKKCDQNMCGKSFLRNTNSSITSILKNIRYQNNLIEKSPSI